MNMSGNLGEDDARRTESCKSKNHTHTHTLSVSVRVSQIRLLKVNPQSSRSIDYLL